ncbi:ATP-binding cassette sub- A member 5, partial [Nowakowskiella sp. JEL0078]
MCLVFLADIILYSCLLALLSHLRQTGSTFFGLLGSLIKLRSSKSVIFPVDSDEVALDVDPVKEDEEIAIERQRLAANSGSDEFVMEVRGLVKSFWVPKPKKKGEKTRSIGNTELKVLQDLYLSLHKNECFGFLGPNGAGKSTAIKILTGLEKATSGSAIIAGLEASPYFTPAIRQSIGLCPQHSVLWNRLTPREHLQVYAAIRAGTSSTPEAEIERVLKAFTLDEFMDKIVGTLSGGNQRKVAMAISMIGNPKL